MKGNRPKEQKWLAQSLTAQKWQRRTRAGSPSLVWFCYGTQPLVLSTCGWGTGWGLLFPLLPDNRTRHGRHTETRWWGFGFPIPTHQQHRSYRRKDCDNPFSFHTDHYNRCYWTSLKLYPVPEKKRYPRQFPKWITFFFWALIFLDGTASLINQPPKMFCPRLARSCTGQNQIPFWQVTEEISMNIQ